MNIPGMTRRRERRQLELASTIEEAVGKALSPAVAVAGQAAAHSGATYPVNQTPNPSDPFSQTGGYGGSFDPLPRGDSTFNSLFGPGYPLVPDPLDSLTEDGRALPRRAQYLVSANLNLIDRRVPWSVLKGLAEDVDVVARCIQLVQDAIVGQDWSWGFSPMILNQIMTEENVTNTSKASALARDKYGAELQRVSEFFDYPDKRMGFTFSQWLTDIIYSHLVYDGIVVYPQYTLGGELHSLSTIDTATIKILLDNQGFLPQPPAPAYQQILYGFPRGEYQAENTDSDGNIPNGYQQDQLAYYIRRPHPSSMYGYSQVEECINIASIYMERQAWLHAEYRHGVTPKMLIETAGTETWTPEQLAYYETIMNDRLSGQTQRRQNMFMLRPGMQAKQMTQDADAYKSVFDEFLIAQIGAKFGVPSALLGLQAKSSLSGGQKNKTENAQSEQFATDALRNFLIDCINDMARRFMGVGPELTITCTGGGDDEDDLTRAQADASDVNSGIRSRNEIRAERGVPLDTSPEADQLGVTSPTGVTFLSGLLDQQKAAAEAAANPPAPALANPPAPGASDDSTEEPDGDADVGQQSSDGGTGKDQGGSDGDGGLGSASGTASAQGSGDSESEGSGKSNATAKDDKRQPDADAEKELATFAKFAKARVERGAWRDFRFDSLSKSSALYLNAAGEVHAKGKGNPDALRDWYNSGADGAIDWGSDGDFDACVAIASKYVDDPEGFCNERHQDATGAPPGHAAGEKSVADPDVADLVVNRLRDELDGLRKMYGLLDEARELTR